MDNSPERKAQLIADAMEERRGLDVMVLAVGDLMSITEYFVICHGRSNTHISAIAESVEEHLGKEGLQPNHREGGRGAVWTILDYGSAVAHVFSEESRDFYDLERLWEDAPVVEHANLEKAVDTAPDEPTDG